MDAALHGQRHRSAVPAGLLRSVVRVAVGAHVTRTRDGSRAARSRRFFSISKAPRRRSRSSSTCCFRMRGSICGGTSRSTRPRLTYASLLDQLREEHAADQRAGEPVPAWVDAPPAARLDSAASYAEWLMDRDRKSTALKDPAGKDLGRGLPARRVGRRGVCRCAAALSRWHAQRRAGRHLLIGKRACPAAALSPLVGRGSHPVSSVALRYDHREESGRVTAIAASRRP